MFYAYEETGLVLTDGMRINEELVALKEAAGTDTNLQNDFERYKREVCV